jgi:hypothetical protein
VFKRKQELSAPVTLTGAAYGLGITMVAPSRAFLDRMRAALPPQWVADQDGSPELRFVLMTDDGEAPRITLNDDLLLEDSLDAMFQLLPSVVRQYVAAEAREAVFVHAGAVAYRGRGIVIPGKSFSGKTTLVAALARAGAEYYSDEYAVIQADGRLIPYPKELSLRMVEGSRFQTERSIADLGGVMGSDPVEIGLLVLTEYRPSATWEPQLLSVAEGMVELLAHTEPVQARPESTLAVVTRALANSKVLKGLRGDADETAAALLAMLT